MLTEEELAVIVRRIVAAYDPDKIVLFGSYSKGTASDRSDLDLFIIKDSSLPRHLRGRTVKSLFYNLPVPVEMQFYTNQEMREQTMEPYSFVSNALLTARAIYTKEERG